MHYLKLICFLLLFFFLQNIFATLASASTSSSTSNTSLKSQYDQYGRLIEFQGKIAVKCPRQKKDTAIILAIGQSNSANHGEKKWKTKYPNEVFHYFNGKCYRAESPIIGASGEEGEFLTPMADQLIASKKFKKIILLSSGIGGTSILRWQATGDLNQMLLNTLAKVPKKFHLTHVIWHQGESDFSLKTTSIQYTKSFNSLLKTLENMNIKVPVYIAIASKCDPQWYEENPIAHAQLSLIDQEKIFLGANTDSLLLNSDRKNDQCHFSESGQLKTATSFANAIM